MIHPFPDTEPGEPIFGYTVLDPFGSAIIDADKRVENRSKPPPARLRGRGFWIAVHTGARLYPDLDRADLTSTSLLHRDPVTDEKHPPLWPECPPFATFRRRVVLGAARVIGCVADGVDPRVDRDRWAMRGQCHWLLDPTVLRLPEPLPCDLGALGLWRLVPRVSDRPARLTPEAWAARIAEGSAVLAALRLARRDPACWRSVPSLSPGAP